MPYLQLDLPFTAEAARKRACAVRLADAHAEIMQTQARIVSVAFRELGPGNVVRNDGPGEGEARLREVVVALCDVRRGRSPDDRDRFARRLCDEVAGSLGWPPDRVVVEFTQHEGSEMFRDGALAPDWSPSERGSDPSMREGAPFRV